MNGPNDVVRVAVDGIYTESVEVEKNSRGYTYSVKVTGEKGKAVAQAFALLDEVAAEVKKRGGDGEATTK